MTCARCSGDLGVTHYVADDGLICEPCAKQLTLSDRMQQLLTAIDGLGLADADVLIEAVRIHRRITIGLTTHGEAKRWLEEVAK